MKESERLSELSMTKLATYSSKIFHEDPESKLANLGL